MFIRYLRKKDRTPFGAVVGLEDGGIGVSLCNKQDAYDKAFGREIALGRAKKHQDLLDRNETDDIYIGPEIQGGRASDEKLDAITQILRQQARAATKE